MRGKAAVLSAVFVAAALALVACSGHGNTIPCIQTMSGMNMCDQAAPSPATARVQQR
jgi:hypothetical protein